MGCSPSPRHSTTPWRQAGEPVQMHVYEHGYHDFVLGPQGQTRRDLPRGEILLQGALDALDRSVAFAKR